MMKFRINQAKGLFFDRAAVQDAIDAAQKRVLPRAGAFIATTAKRSMRPARQKATGSLSEAERKRFERQKKLFKEGKIATKPKRPLVASNPGEPPRVRTGLLKKHLFFAYDPASKSLVVGPALLNKSSGAPATLENGGSTLGIVTREITLADGTTGTATKKVQVQIAPRPFMKPALEANQAAIRGLFRDSIRK